MDEAQGSQPLPSDACEEEENITSQNDEADGSVDASLNVPEEKPTWVTGLIQGDSEWSGSYVWKVEDFTRLRVYKIGSTEFDIGTYTWRILLFPYGHYTFHHRDYVSVSVDYPEADFTPVPICPRAKFEIRAINQFDDKQTVKKEAEHQFTWQAKDWGFADFLQLEDAVHYESGFVENDDFIITAKITVEKDAELYGLVREATGFVGLKDQYAPSYRNSLLQCLYHLPYIRKLVYRVPTAETDDPQRSTLFALQRLFYQLQYKNSSVSPSALMKSLNWEVCDPFLKHDIREMQSIFSRKIEEGLKGTDFEGRVSELFIGRYTQYVETVESKIKQARETTYTELELDVKGCKNIYESFEKFCRTEKLEGENVYPLEKLGLREARRFIRFESFPPILFLHLRRFSYEPGRSAFIKVTGHFEFYNELDLDSGSYAFHSKKCNKKIENKYTLHSVLAHGGGVSGGHYFVFIKSEGKWYRFDNRIVKEETPDKAMKEQFGYDENDLSSYSGTGEEPSAYMLIYVRNSEWDRIMCECDEQDIATPVREKLQAEQLEKEKRRKEKQEAHLYVVITLVCEKHLVEQIGAKHYLGLTNFEDVATYRVHKRTLFTEFQELVHNDFGIEPDRQRYWFWSQGDRDRATIDKPLDLSNANLKTVLDMRHLKKIEMSKSEKRALLRIQLFLETPETEGIVQPIVTDQLLVFVKLYTPQLRKLTFISHLYVNKGEKFEKILELAGDRAGLPTEADIIGFREANGVCTELAATGTPEEMQFKAGQIIVIQERIPDDEQTECLLPTAKTFLEDIWNRLEVNFKPMQRPHDDGFKLELNRSMSYLEIVTQLAKYLEVDDIQKIRLMQHNIYSQLPYKNPIHPDEFKDLEAMIFNTDRESKILYYEVLTETLAKMEATKQVTIQFYNSKTKLQSIHQFRLSKESTIGNVVAHLKAELGSSYADCDIRVMQVRFSKIFKILDADTALDQVNESYWALRAEVVPEDERNLKLDEFLVHCCHCETYYEAITTFGDPLWIRIKLGEKLKDLKERVQAKLDVPYDEIASWKFACRIGHMQLLVQLNDCDEVIPRFPQGHNKSWGDGMYIGDNIVFVAMEHKNTYEARKQHQLDRWNFC